MTRKEAPTLMKVCFQRFRDKIPRDRIRQKCGRIVTRYHEHFIAPFVALPTIAQEKADG
jgi:hypothetical protein